MASSLGFEGENPHRIMSGILYVLQQNGLQNGHVCLPEDRLVEASARMLSVEPEAVKEALSALMREGSVHYVLQNDRRMIYDAISYEDEKYIAEKLVHLDKMCASVDLRDIDRFIEQEEEKSGIRYAFLQKKAISDALRYGVMVLTGGPGTGKTTVVRALIHIFDSMGMDIALAAPTGRAAKRLSEATSMEAKTVHRLLEMNYDPSGKNVFQKNEHDLLEEQVVIVDEASMMDNGLMCALLRAIKPGARFVIIGDSDQLPSVGAGNVLRDILDSNRFASVRLCEIFRQAEQSLIVTNAHAINQGQMPNLGIKNNDFFFLPRSSDRDIALTVADLSKNRLPRTYGEMARQGIQVIAPSRKGESGTEQLNILLQQSLNPPTPQKREHRFRDRVFREGDRVMQITNNYEIEWTRGHVDGMGVFNGDIGTIQKIDSIEQTMTVRFDDKLATYDFDLLDELELAYAITVHKSQGSEYPVVIIPMYSCPPMLMTRNLLYTAVTRAKKMVVMVGRADIVSKMVKNNSEIQRYTTLMHRIAAEK
jgi:exodeoxyribonuclease V alpha subunit